MQVLTSLSGLPISAASAGFAPTNSADVSAIASAYQVVSSTGTQLHAGTAYLTGVNGAPISASRAGQAANASLATSAYYDGTGRLISALPDSAAVSAIASSYAESAASGKQDELTFGYDANNLISSIDGSALAGQGGGGGGSVASPSGTIIVTDGTAIEATNSAIGTVQLPPVVTAEGAANTYTISTSQYTQLEYANERACGVGITFYSGSEWNLAFAAPTEDGLLTASAHCESGDTSAYVIFSESPLIIYQTQVSASGNGGQVSLSGTKPVLYLEQGGTADGVQELAWASALPTYEYDGDGKISAIDGSALAGGGGGGVDSATVSAIASSYVESGVSSKLDSSASSDFYSTGNPSGFVGSAYVDSAVSGKMDSSASSSFYTTANESGFVDSAYVESSVSGKQDASAMSSYALSSDVSGTVDLVSSQSANWGGSALQLSAGPGVTLTKSGNVLVAGLDETVLWSGEGSAGNFALSEDPYNFETLRIYGSWQAPELSVHDVMIGKASAWNNKFMIAGFAGDSDSNDYMYARDTWFKVNNSGYNISAYKASETVFVGTNIDRQSSSPWAYRRIYKVVGINRTAGV